MKFGHLFATIFVRYLWEIVIVLYLGILLLVVAFAPRTQYPIGADPAGRSPPGATTDNLVYFLQISDVHLSIYHPERGEKFVTFCSEVVPTVNPSLVILTGDITDAVKYESPLPYYKNQQHIAEWDFYRDTLLSYGYFNKSFWLDIRGNHDAYAVASPSDPNNFFLTHAVYGDVRDYSFELTTSFGSYQFVSMDLTFQLGLSAPFQFFGLRPTDLDTVTNALDASKNFNHTILLGHYPRVTTVNNFPWTSLTKGRVLAYLCGHIHAKKMVSFMPEKYMELELQDMKIHRMYRIMAYDHDLFSFRDEELGQWPLILITNPKDARFYSTLEPLDLIAQSTHIRVLVFSPNPVIWVSVNVNQVTLNMTRAEPGSPLYIAPWNPSELSGGTHNIEVTAADTTGTQVATMQFSVDKTPADIDQSSARFLQNFPGEVFAQVSFALLYVYTMGVMLLLPMGIPVFRKFRGHEYNEARLSDESCNETLWGVIRGEFRHKLVVYNSLSRFNWWVMLIFWINLAVGPMVVGPVVNSNNYGVTFLWGALADLDYTPSVESLLIGLFLLFFLYLPTLRVLMAIDYSRLHRTRLVTPGGVFYFLCFLCFSAFFLFTLIYYQTWSGFLLSPAVTWFILVAFGLMGVSMVKHRHSRMEMELLLHPT